MTTKVTKVLIVDDEEKIRGLYKKVLRAEGFEVTEAENGERAAMILLHDRDIDLFVVDIQMPVVGGASFFEAVRVFNPHAKIIVSSVFPLDEQRRLIGGADDYFDKSEGVPVLLDRIKHALDGRPQ